MFNIQPGTGLGYSGSREIALGLGGVIVGVVADAGRVIFNMITSNIITTVLHDVHDLDPDTIEVIDLLMRGE